MYACVSLLHNYWPSECNMCVILREYPFARGVWSHCTHTIRIIGWHKVNRVRLTDCVCLADEVWLFESRACRCETRYILTKVTLPHSQYTWIGCRVTERQADKRVSGWNESSFIFYYHFVTLPIECEILYRRHCQCGSSFVAFIKYVYLGTRLMRVTAFYLSISTQ